jgi:ATP-dependent Lhr-like helicase
MLLERYGIVSREAVEAEAIPGGFGPIYRVLRQMEEGGRVRRGYFVEGLSGAQFALAGALDRLRGARVDEVPVDGWTQADARVLAAADPANPFGALLPWPEPGGGQAPKRTSGARVILVAGKPVLYLSASARNLTTFPASITEAGNELPLALTALQQAPRIGRRRILIGVIDGEPALKSRLREKILSAGFEADYDALTPTR